MHMQVENLHLLAFPIAGNSRLADTALLQTLAITEKIQIPFYRSLTENDSWY